MSGSLLGHFLVMLWTFLGHFLVMLGSHFGHLLVMSGSRFRVLGDVLGCVWEWFGDVFGWVWEGLGKNARGGRKHKVFKNGREYFSQVGALQISIFNHSTFGNVQKIENYNFPCFVYSYIGVGGMGGAIK